MRALSILARLAFLALASACLATAGCGGGGSGSSPLVLLGISVPDFGQWECNRPIEFVFD